MNVPSTFGHKQTLAPHYSTAPWYRSVGSVLQSLLRELLKWGAHDDLGRRAKDTGVDSGDNCNAVGSLELRLDYSSVQPMVLTVALTATLLEERERACETERESLRERERETSARAHTHTDRSQQRGAENSKSRRKHLSPEASLKWLVISYLADRVYREAECALTNK